jgi:kinesin family protein 18/19
MKNNQLLNIVLPNLKNSEDIKKNIKIDFNEMKKKIIDKSKENEAKRIGKINPKKFSKGELKGIFAKNSLIVAVRIRKLNNKDIEFSANETIKKIDRDTLVISEPINPDINSHSENPSIVKPQKIKENYFSYDFIFDKDTTQEEIYLNTSKLLVQEVLEGYNATVFAYGATGSGKTYTMVGNGESPGIMVRAVSDLFSMIELKKNNKFIIKVIYVEVYNENIRDLITGKSDLEVREDPKIGMQILGASEELVLNAGDVFKLLM